MYFKFSFHFLSTSYPIASPPFLLLSSHIDFGGEVCRSVTVCDGGVVVLDGFKGVQAQTVTVWKELDRWDTPRLILINKLDHPGASVVRGDCVCVLAYAPSRRTLQNC